MILRAIRRYLRQLASFSRNARLFLLSTVITGLAYSIYMLIFNLFVDSQGYSRSFLGMLQSMPNFVALLGAIPAGLLVDYIGRKRAFLVANAMRTAAALGIILAHDPNLLLFYMAMSGVAGALWMVSGAPFMMENSTPKERNALFSANFGLQTLVGVFGTLIGGYLPTMFNASKRQHNARLEEIRERAEAERVPLLPTIRSNS